VASGGPVPGQELGEAFGGMGGELGEDVGEPGGRIEAVELGGLGQSVDCGGALATVVGTGEQPVLAAKDQGADRPLGGVVVDLEAAVVAIAGELRPAAQPIADGSGELALAGDAPEARLQPGFELIAERSGVALAGDAA